MTPNQLNITVGSDVILNVTLVHEEETLIPALIDNLEANLISGLGTRTALETGLGADYITIAIPWVEGRLAGCYSLEVKGSINGLAWAAIGKGLIRYTNATEAGADSVTVEADAYDVTMEAGYHWTDSPIAAVAATIDDQVGTPSVDVTYQHKVLGLVFHNLKGVQGIQGIQGPQGPQGDSFQPIEDVSGLVLAHTLGQDNTKAMSQKGVTDAISGFAKMSYSSSDLSSGNMNNSVIGQTVDYGTVVNFYSGLFPVVQGRQGIITTKGGTGTSRAYCFLDEDMKVLWCSDDTAVHSSEIFEIPSDAAYIGVNFVNDGSTTFSLLLNGIEDLESMAVTSKDSPDEGDIEITDENKNVILKIAGGHIKTKYFDSASLPVPVPVAWNRRNFFKISVNTNFYYPNFNTVNLNDLTEPTYYEDNCVLYLPESYNAEGDPTKVIIYCKPGDTTIEENADTILTGTNTGRMMRYMLYLGYAILAADGVPNGWASALGLGERAVGNYVAVQSTIKAYDYAFKHFNLDKDGVYIFGYSQGGHYAMNVIENSDLPIRTAVLLSPAVSMRYHQWDLIASVTVGGVTFNKAARLNIVRMFEMADVNNDTELLATEFNPDKVVGYDPWTRNVENPYTNFVLESNLWKLPNGTSIDDIGMVKHVKCPIKIFVATNDTSLGADVTKVFAKAIRNAGQVVDIKVYSDGGHVIPGSQTSIGTFIENGSTCNLYPCASEMADWLNLFGGY